MPIYAFRKPSAVRYVTACVFIVPNYKRSRVVRNNRNRHCRTSLLLIPSLPPLSHLPSFPPAHPPRTFRLHANKKKWRVRVRRCGITRRFSNSGDFVCDNENKCIYFYFSCIFSADTYAVIRSKWTSAVFVMVLMSVTNNKVFDWLLLLINIEIKRNIIDDTIQCYCFKSTIIKYLL